jgi:hypothetical protein
MERARGRKKMKEPVKQEDLFEEEVVIPKVKKKELPEFPTDEELSYWKTDTYEEILAYNEAVRKNRMRTRKATIPFKFVMCEKDKMPEDIIPMRKVRMTRSSQRGTPISINLKDAKNYVHLQGVWDDGAEDYIPECMINRINELAEPKYKQVKYPDGSHATVLDYMDNKYAVQIMMD